MVLHFDPARVDASWNQSGELGMLGVEQFKKIVPSQAPAPKKHWNELNETAHSGETLALRDQ